MNTAELKQILEGAILAADRPLNIDQLLHLFVLEAPSRDEIRSALEEIANDCEGRGFELKEVASGYRFQVRKELGEWVARLWEEKPPRYTRALLETLALIAYKQPTTRGDIEEIRGVSVTTNIIRTLLEREWIRIVGHRDMPGRPAIYATTKVFLDYFDLKSLDELPTLSEIKDLAKGEEFDLEDEPIEIRSLALTADEADLKLVEDEDLKRVSERVDVIQENIRNFMDENAENADEFGSAEAKYRKHAEEHSDEVPPDEP